MKKITIFFALVVPLLLAGCSPNPSSESTTPQTSNQTNEENGIFESIKDAMSRSLSLKCQYTDKNGQQTVYVKGSSIRVEGVQTEQGVGNVIYKDNKTWVWTGNTGMIMDLSKMTLPEGNQQMTEEEMIAQLEEQKNNCQVAVVDDAKFTPPAEVTFQDMTEFQNQFTQ